MHVARLYSRSLSCESWMFFAYTCAFALAWWLGLYLLARNPRKPLLLRAGLGLLAYALTICCAALTATTRSPYLAQFYTLLVFLPALCWTGTLLCLLPLGEDARQRIDRIWSHALVPVSLLIVIFAVGSGIAILSPSGEQTASLGLLLLALLFGVPLVLAFGLAAWGWQQNKPNTAWGLLIVITLFFGLGMVLLMIPFNGQVPPWAILSVGIDLGVLGLAIALLDAFDEGETLRPDMVRSLIAAGMSAMAFGSLVGLAMLAGVGATSPMIALLLSVVALAIAAPTLADTLQELIDRVAFAQTPALQRVRADLRESASILPKVAISMPLNTIDEGEFVRLTRRALSQMNDLGRLAANPLTQLPVVELRLRERGVSDQPLERAAELRELLTESVARLKPRNNGDFGTSDAWRYYNALYFPYVAGLRPYSRRTNQEATDPAAQHVLNWFAAQVPERTLHNWQNTAARIVAEDLQRILAVHGS